MITWLTHMAKDDQTTWADYLMAGCLDLLQVAWIGWIGWTWVA